MKLSFFYFSDLVDGYNYYGDEQATMVEKRSNMEQMISDGEGSTIDSPDEGLLTNIPNSTSTPISTLDFDLFEHLMKEIRTLHSSIADLKESITKLVLQTEVRVNVSHKVTVMLENKSSISLGGVTSPVDADLEKLKLLNIDIEKLLVLESDFADFPDFNTTEVDIYVHQLGTTSFFDTISSIWNYIVSNMVEFGSRLTSDSWTLVWFCLFVFGFIFFFIGTVYICCKYICCKNCLTKEKSINTHTYEEIRLNNISDPILWDTTNAHVFVNRSCDFGTDIPIRRKLVRSTSLNSTPETQKPTFSTFIPSVPPSTPIPIPPPLPPKRSVSLPNTPALKKRVAFTYDVPVEHKETSV